MKLQNKSLALCARANEWVTHEAATYDGETATLVSWYADVDVYMKVVVDVLLWTGLTSFSKFEWRR